ncbi:MAG TPA: thiamine pyrophosphate-dependent enzyme [Opitutaceae bacterium]|jgi:2-oxoisovalerate dehydrogenase E1 component|nr:thiamine pyrophosphate-dependent enzyme [Opitutaceae bacterium]
MLPLASTLTPALKRRLLLTILESRHGDLREESLNRQGKGHFHVSGRGHEAMAALGMLMERDDYACPYYRDRAFVLGRGVTTRQLALDYMAKRESSSHGRQMPSHYSYPEFHVWSVPTPTASQLLPGCGMAWGMKLDGKPSLTVATVGDAATRQGDFFEAAAFAKERALPLLLVVEDNGYGISSRTRRINPLALGVLNADDWIVLDGWDPEAVYLRGAEAMAGVRQGKGPAFLWIRMERLSSHTSSDDQKIYRPAEELSTLDERDPLKVLSQRMIDDGEIAAEEFARLGAETRERVREDYAAAERAENPAAAELETNVAGPPPDLDEQIFRPGRYRMGDMINLTLRAGLQADRRRVMFGEDIEDPKGGVFTLTKRLSTEFPAQVFNSPLAESTILGVACGLASYGRRPVFELQFIDFVYPGWNQLVSNLATLRWRTYGKWTCPAVIYAPYGAYLPGGSLWHSQANESALAHYPGLNVVIPCTPEDAAGLLWTAMHSEDPTLVLIPKHMLWVEREVREAVQAVPLGRARRWQEGRDVTVVAWGNTVEKSLEAVALLGGGVSVELIDLRSIVPWDRDLIARSVGKTGRLVVVQEDTENCSVGQMIISHLAGQPEVWSRLKAPPLLVSKGNVMIGYNPVYEFAALPDARRIAAAIADVMAHAALPREAAAPHAAPAAPEAAAEPPAQDEELTIRVPILGEGIRTVRIVSILKQAGDRVAPDEALCEVETDKAVYPIEAPAAGTVRAWRIHEGETAEIGRELLILSAAAGSAPPPSLQALQRPEDRTSGAALQDALAPRAAPIAPARPARAASGQPEPALSPAIVRRMGGVVPANMQMDARWKAVAEARAAAKAAGLDLTPSLIAAWCVVQAMKRHPPFRRTVDGSGQIDETEHFDLGLAVALDLGRLATAVIAGAADLDWAAFADAYHEAIARARAGQLPDVKAPLNLTSLGAFGVEGGTPIVVPPAMGTLFVGTAHPRMVEEDGVVFPVDVATLSLTFDHRVVNGAGAAAFLHDVKTGLEAFKAPR